MNGLLPSVQRIIMLSVHTSPLANLGGEKAGGMNVYIRDFSRALAQQGVLVDIFTRTTQENQPQILYELGAGVRVIHIPAGPKQAIPVGDVDKYLDEFTDGVLAFVRAEGVRYDVIHAHYWLSGLVAERLRAAWGGTPFVQMFHTLGHLKNSVAQNEHERAPQARLDGEAHVVRVADRLIAATPIEEEQLLDLYQADAAKIIVIPPGVDLARFQPLPRDQARDLVGLPSTHHNVLFAGRIEPLKGIDTLLQAVAILQRRYPDVMVNTHVTIIGGDTSAQRRNAEMARLQELRCQLNLCRVVGFVGAKTQDILPHYFAAADVVVVPSLYESFGLVALEAMAMSTPVIASDVGGLSHLVQHGYTGFHTPPRDPEALAVRICTLLTHPELRQQLGTQARIHAQQYDWSRVVQRMLQEVYAPLYREPVSVRSVVRSPHSFVMCSQQVPA